MTTVFNNKIDWLQTRLPIRLSEGHTNPPTNQTLFT